MLPLLSYSVVSVAPSGSVTVINVMQDADYLKFLQQEQELCSQYECLNLSDDQRKVILNWIDTINAMNEAYTAVVFRMAMQCCFALILELADLKSPESQKWR